MFDDKGDPVLTDRQRQILDFLTKYADAHGYPPTVREIGEAVGLASPSTVHAHLANLERVGLLKRDPTKPRAIELRREPKAAPVPAADVHKLPLVGEIAAGGPLLAEENIEDYLAVPEPLSRGGEEFLLRVKGDAARADPREGDRSLPPAVTVESLNRTLEQELFALLRGASMECLVCGEFVLRRGSAISCPECGSQYEGAEGPRLQLSLQAG
jgi:hypothetical protein